MVQFTVFQDFRVQRGHAVGAVGKVDIHMGHVDYIVRVYDGGGGVAALTARQRIQLFDDGYQLRNYLLQIVFRPFFQSFRQNGVICISAGFGDDFNGFLEGNVFFAQQPDEFRYDHGRVRVVNLDGGIFVEVMEIAAPLQAFLEDQLRPCADHQILLVNPKEASGIIAVVGVEEQGKVLPDICLVETDAVPDNGLLHGVQIEQVQIIGAPLIAGDGNPVKPCGIWFSCQGYGIGFGGFLCPVMAAQPEIGCLILKILREILTEESAVIPESDAVAGEV